MANKTQVARMVAKYDFGDFASINDIIRFTHENSEELGFQFDWIDEGGMWAIAFGNKSKDLKHGAIVFDWEVEFDEQETDLKYLTDFIFEYVKDCRYYNNLKINQ